MNEDIEYIPSSYETQVAYMSLLREDYEARARVAQFLLCRGLRPSPAAYERLVNRKYNEIIRAASLRSD